MRNKVVGIRLRKFFIGTFFFFIGIFLIFSYTSVTRKNIEGFTIEPANMDSTHISGMVTAPLAKMITAETK